LSDHHILLTPAPTTTTNQSEDCDAKPKGTLFNLLDLKYQSGTSAVDRNLSVAIAIIKKKRDTRGLQRDVVYLG
jgi:hypothetical protein